MADYEHTRPISVEKVVGVIRNLAGHRREISANDIWEVIHDNPPVCDGDTVRTAFNITQARGYVRHAVPDAVVRSARADSHGALIRL